MMPTMPPDAHKISLKIIEAIRQHPVLYISDVKGTAVKLQEFRQKVWKRISDELGLDPGWVRLKWKNLRDTYCRILKYKSKNEKGTRRKKWIFEDHLSFLKFPYEQDYVPQCVELSDEYIEEINSGEINSEDLLEQLEDRSDDDYSEYLEVLEETTADPILSDDTHIVQVFETSPQQLADQITDNNNSHENIQHDIDVYAQHIQAKYRKIRPKKMKIENIDENSDDTNITHNYGIMSPNFKIEQLKTQKDHNIIVSPIMATSSSTTTKNTLTTQSSLKEEQLDDQVYLAPLEKTSVELFFNSMSQTVKSLPPKAQAEIKMAVCKIVTEAEAKYSRKKTNVKTRQQFIAPPGMIPKLVLVPCSMIDISKEKS